MAAGAAIPAAKSVSPKPRKITRKAGGTTSESVEPKHDPIVAAAMAAAIRIW